MLSVPIRGDGTIDAKEREIVEEVGIWMRRYGDAIYGSRPWRIHAKVQPDLGAGPYLKVDGIAAIRPRTSGMSARAMPCMRWCWVGQTTESSA